MASPPETAQKDKPEEDASPPPKPKEVSPSPPPPPPSPPPPSPPFPSPSKDQPPPSPQSKSGNQPSPSTPPPPSKDQPSPSTPPPPSQDQPSPSTPPPPSQDQPSSSPPPPPSQDQPSSSTPPPSPSEAKPDNPAPAPPLPAKNDPPSPPSPAAPSKPISQNTPPGSGGASKPISQNTPSGSGGALPSKQGQKSSPSRDSGSRKSQSKDDNDSNQALAIGVAVGVVLLLVLILICAIVCYCKKKKKNRNPGYYSDARRAKDYYNGNGSAPPKWRQQGGDHNIKILPPPGMGGGGWQHGPPAPLSSEMSSPYSGPHGTALPPPSPNFALGFNQSTFTYEEIAAATNGFDQANMIGQGGFGYVFKGILPNGKEVAVKQLKAGSGQGEREFQAEVEIISRVHHRHLVSLAGYCITGTQRILLYEFVPNKTLEYHLHGKGVPTMDWPTRLKIAIGSAKGLAYLHEDCHPRIIHRDIKTANILLDYKFEAMVADFGLAKLTNDTNTHVSTRIMGTFGYLAPEYASSGKLTDKSDVFSYGVVLLELITGRRPVDHTHRMEDSLVDWARPILGQVLAEEKFEEVVDPNLMGNFHPPEMARMISCAAACVRHSARRRPRMSQIVRALEGDAVSFDDQHEVVKPGQSSQYGSSSDFESGTYSSKMRQFQKVAMASGEYTGEYSGMTSEYGLNPSESSNSSEEMNIGAGHKPRQGV